MPAHEGEDRLVGRIGGRPEQRSHRVDVARPQRIGLSATQKPIERIGAVLVGDRAPPRIVDAGFARELDLAIEVPEDELGAVATHEMMAEFYERIVELTKQHRTTLVFTNTRRLCERVAHHLSERLGEEKVAAHHGSLSRETRLSAEMRLKAGQLAVIVATVLQPGGAWLRRHRVPSALAALTMLLLFLLAVTLVIVILAPQVAGQTPALVRSASAGLQTIRDWMTEGPLSVSEGQITRAIEAIQDKLRESADAISSGVFSTIGAATSAIVTWGRLEKRRMMAA